MNLDLLRGNRNLLFWALHTLGWSAYGLAQYVGSAVYGKEPGYVQVIAIAAAAGFLLSAPLRLVYRRLWAAGPRAMLIGSPLVCWLVALAWRAIINTAYMDIVKPEWAMEHTPKPLEIFVGTLSSMALLLCWTGLYYGVKFYERLQLEREATLRQSALAQEAQLKMLRYQLNPHFLFNTLNAISTLVLDGQNRTANLAVSRLSEFLRYTLDQDPMKKVTLRQELDALNLYLGIEKLRFGDRLRLEFDVDERAESALVPSLLLQPLVENAMKYAISPREEGGSVTILAGIESGGLRLAVQDDGPGLPPVAAAVNGRGVGLRNTRERLTVLYGDRHRIDVVDVAPGLRVEMRLPLEI
ncbi:MAG: histidine kinase [Pseudomonadota bacterium]|nr:histidine kinase [Pseudomonadota bacterium]